MCRPRCIRDQLKVATIKHVQRGMLRKGIDDFHTDLFVMAISSTDFTTKRRKHKVIVSGVMCGCVRLYQNNCVIL